MYDATVNVYVRTQEVLLDTHVARRLDLDARLREEGQGSLTPYDDSSHVGARGGGGAVRRGGCVGGCGPGQLRRRGETRADNALDKAGPDPIASRVPHLSSRTGELRKRGETRAAAAVAVRARARA